MTQNYYTTRQAAKLLGISVRSAQIWVEKGTLHAWKTLGGHRRISRDSVQRMLRAQSAALDRETYSLPLLILEDDAALLKLYQRNIETWTFPVTLYTAPSGSEGLLMMGEVMPQMLICDLRLPGVDGFEIVRSLCAIERYSNTLIVVVTGLDKEEVAARGGLPERVELLGKPIDFARLQSIAQRLWSRNANQTATIPPLPTEAD